MLVVIEYRFYVASKRLLCFKSTFLIIIIIVIKVIISGGISSTKIYFPKSDHDFKQLVGTVYVRTRSWPTLMHYRFLVGACRRTRNFLGRIISHGQELELGFRKNKAEMLTTWRDLESSPFKFPTSLNFKVIMWSTKSRCKVRYCISRNPSQCSAAHYNARLEINSSQISDLLNDLCHWVRKSYLLYVGANAAVFFLFRDDS